MNGAFMGMSLIGGEWTEGRGDDFKSVCPATGETVWEGQEASADQVADAVQAARLAFDDWSQCPLNERRDILERYACEIGKRREIIAEAISRDMGKLIIEARAEADSMVNKIAVSISAQDERAGNQSRRTDFGSLHLTHRPHGVMAVFGPFNFPGHLPNGHIVPALLAGNTCVFKPSELAPSVASIMMDCFTEAGLPEGCINLVQGGRNTGKSLLNSDIDGLLFTGSEKTGRAFHAHYSGRPDIMLALELGGNNPLIIWDPADLEQAADIALQSAFITTGQRCTCSRRLILPEGKSGDVILETIIERTRNISIGPWHDEKAYMGPLVSPEAARNAIEFQAKLLESGGRSAVELKQPVESLGFVTPGVVEMKDSIPVDEECFAPLLQVYRVASLEEAVSLSNATRFGLSASIVSKDKDLWRKVSPRIRAGILNFNRPTTGASSAMPFGGPGMSGNQRPGGYYAADYCAWPQASQIAELGTCPKV